MIMPECNHGSLDFSSHYRRKIGADFETGPIMSVNGA